MLMFDTFRSSRLVEAYETVREILERYINDEDEWDESLGESAKGSIIYSWTEKEETVDDLVEQTVKAYMRQTDSSYNRSCTVNYSNGCLVSIRCYTFCHLRREFSTSILFFGTPCKKQILQVFVPIL